MKDLSAYLDDAYLVFLNSPINCCFPQEPVAPRNAPRNVVVRPTRIELDQPHLVPAPLFASPTSLERPPTRGRKWISRTKSFTSRASSRGSFSARKKLNAYDGPRRPRIGPPLDFRMVEESSYSSPRRTDYFRPLELSILAPENRLSSLLPYFGITDPGYDECMKALPSPPPLALVHSRRESDSSFQIPRKPVRSSSGTSSDWITHFNNKQRPETISANELLAAQENPPPIMPPAARLRAMTEAPSYERLRSAIHEKFELEHRLKDVEELIEERKSIYFSSRPTSLAGSEASSIIPPAEEPLPPLPLKINTTSAETLRNRPARPHNITRAPLPLVDRPKTAPPRTVLIPTRLKSFTEASAAFSTPSPSSSTDTPADYSPIPPPPLPLVLQAPRPLLRKRKSFSRVSNWLFPASSSSTNEHERNIFLDSVTNTPKPVTSRDGFYQCVGINQNAQMSTASVSTITTLESELEEPSLPTMYSPQSSPGERAEKRKVEIRDMSMDSQRTEESVNLTRTRTFGEKEDERSKWRIQVLPRMTSVGVAF